MGGAAVTWLLPLPIVLPLLGASLSVLAGRAKGLQRTVGLVTLLASTVVSVVLLVEVDRGGTMGGGWGRGRGRGWGRGG